MKINIRDEYKWEAPDIKDVEANIFAFHLLMPDSILEDKLTFIGHKIDLMKINNPDINFLSQFFQVEYNAVLIRLAIKYFSR